MLSTHARGIVLSIAGVVIGAVNGCAPSSPIVANPTDPWEYELVRERQAAQNAESKAAPSSMARQMYDTDEDKEQRKHSELVVALTDIIGFPFRGVGWLAREMF